MKEEKNEKKSRFSEEKIKGIREKKEMRRQEKE